MFRLDLTTYDG